MSCAVLSFAVWRPSSIHTGLTAIISFIISMTSGPKQSGLEAIDTAAMSSLLAAARNFSRKASTSPYVFVYDWKYAIYLSHLHLPDILFFASSICSPMLRSAFSEKSPEHLLYIYPYCYLLYTILSISDVSPLQEQGLSVSFLIQHREDMHSYPQAPHQMLCCTVPVHSLPRI